MINNYSKRSQTSISSYKLKWYRLIHSNLSRNEEKKRKERIEVVAQRGVVEHQSLSPNMVLKICLIERENTI